MFNIIAVFDYFMPIIKLSSIIIGVTAFQVYYYATKNLSELEKEEDDVFEE
tara:strand:+ start:182 stop:334 length:153 start_codon:yes stop_codon:yes gene_type:complete